MQNRSGNNRQGPIKHWRIHIGAHKTATTHLQDTLALHREQLAEAGVDYIPRQVFRKKKLKMGKGTLGWRMWFGGMGIRRKLNESLDGLLGGLDTVLLSEESLLGSPRDLLTNPFYGGAEHRLEALASLGKQEELDLFLSIRSTEKTLSSAYSHVILRHPLPENFKAIAERTLRRPPRWSDLVARARKTIPNARLHVWTLEDYTRQPNDIMSQLCGVELPIHKSLPPPLGTQSVSNETIARLEQLDPSLGRVAYQKAAALIAESDDRTNKFSPFSDSESKILAESYAEDLDRIERNFPGVLFRP